MTFSSSKLDIHEFTAARCRLLFSSVESIAGGGGGGRRLFEKGSISHNGNKSIMCNK